MLPEALQQQPNPLPGQAVLQLPRGLTEEAHIPSTHPQPWPTVAPEFDVEVIEEVALESGSLSAELLTVGSCSALFSVPAGSDSEQHSADPESLCETTNTTSELVVGSSFGEGAASGGGGEGAASGGNGDAGGADTPGPAQDEASAAGQGENADAAAAAATAVAGERVTDSPPESDDQYENVSACELRKKVLELQASLLRDGAFVLTPVVWDGASGSQEKLAMRRAGFLFSMYRADVWWFEILEMIRKLIINGVLVYIVHTEIRAAVGFAVCFLSLVVSMQMRPFASPKLNQLMVTGLAFQTTTLTYGILINVRNNALEDTSASRYFWT